LDYRALLDTNYVFQNGEINLFNVLVKRILHSWSVSVAGRGRVNLGTLWEETLAKRIPPPAEQYAAHLARGGGRIHRSQNHTPRRIASARDTAEIFNVALRSNLKKIVLLGNRLLRRLGVQGLSFVLTPTPVTYDVAKREFSPQHIGIRVGFNGAEIPRPQLFLNEARLSALALALYFAALLKVVPEDPAWPRILVLDDVLIGLDMDNRLPVLDLLSREFRDWQILLLTHDRTWFEMAQLATEDDDRWVSFEMYARPDEMFNRRIVEVPCKKEIGDSPAEHFLDRARQFLANHDDRSAAFYARAAFEAKLKSYCHKKKVSVAYDLTGHKLTTEDFMDAIERRLASSGEMARARFQFARVRMFRNGVLNPLAHFHPVTISPGEVERAIEAVAALQFPTENPDCAKEINSLLRKAILTPDELLASACWLRTSFEIDLRDLLTRFTGVVAFRDDWNKLVLAELWVSAQSVTHARDPVLAPLLIADIETHRPVFLDEFAYSRVSGFNKTVLEAAWTALRDAAHTNPVRTRLATFP
jgi:hypothetical protein